MQLQPNFDSGLLRLAETNVPQQNSGRHHISIDLIPADHGTEGLSLIDVKFSWLPAPIVSEVAISSKASEVSRTDTYSMIMIGTVSAFRQYFLVPPVFDINFFSSRNELLMTIASVFTQN